MRPVELLPVLMLVCCCGPPKVVPSEGSESQEVTGMTLDKALAARRSVRDLDSDPLTGEQLRRLAWAGQGRTSPEGFRTAPSAGATFHDNR